MVKVIEGSVCSPKGFLASGIHCGFRKNLKKKDFGLIVSEKICSAAVVATTNKVKGAPIAVTKEHVKNGYAQAIICNSGNANTCSSNGRFIAEETCRLVSEQLNISKEDIIVASTGVIGADLKMEPFERGIPQLVAGLSIEGQKDAAGAILTTDTCIKEKAVEFEIKGHTCRIGGIAKGSGMVNPQMATVLSFITSDVAISPEMLKKAFSAVVKGTYNQVSIDGETSTNDMAAILANGLAGNDMITQEDEDYVIFYNALWEVMKYLTELIAGDGEGASKKIHCRVLEAETLDIARNISKSIVTSGLVKTAVFGEDANWGRIMCAIGYTPGDFSVDNTEVTLISSKGSVVVCKDACHVEFSEEDAAAILSADEITIEINMHNGTFEADAWGCDLTYDYVKINGNYRKPGTSLSNKINLQSAMEKAQSLIEALPYIQTFNNSIIVIKYGGAAMEDEKLMKSVMEDATLLKLVGFKPIIVHGGGKEISRWTKKVGIEPNFINGLRVTDADTLEIAEMVLSKINKKLVTDICRLGVPSVGISGKDGGFLMAEKKTSEGQDIGFVGRITTVNVKILEDLLEKGFLPVIYPIGADEDGQSYNINADDAASAIAQAIGAQKLAYLTDTDGVLMDKDDNNSIIPELYLQDAKNLINSGIISGGMIPKLNNCIEAIEGGVSRVHILNGKVPHSLLLEIFTNKGVGTAVLNQKEMKFYHE